jgi:hypothetical protein
MAAVQPEPWHRVLITNNNNKGQNCSGFLKSKWVVVFYKFSQFTLSHLLRHTKQNTTIIFHLCKTLHPNFIALRCWQRGISRMEFLLPSSKVRF